LLVSVMLPASYYPEHFTEFKKERSKALACKLLRTV
jgi:hypothetical protein